MLAARIYATWNRRLLRLLLLFQSFGWSKHVIVAERQVIQERIYM